MAPRTGCGHRSQLPQVIVELQDRRASVRLSSTRAQIFHSLRPEKFRAIAPQYQRSRAHDGANAGGNAATGTGATRKAEDCPTIVALGGEVRLQPHPPQPRADGDNLSSSDEPAYSAPFDAGAPLGFDGVLGVAAAPRADHRLDFLSAAAGNGFASRPPVSNQAARPDSHARILNLPSAPVRAGDLDGISNGLCQPNTGSAREKPRLSKRVRASTGIL